MIEYELFEEVRNDLNLLKKLYDEQKMEFIDNITREITT